MMALSKTLPLRRHRHAAGRQVAGAMRRLFAGLRSRRGMASIAIPPQAEPQPVAARPSTGDEAWARFQSSLAAGG